jgi:hypothetical protein
MSISKCHKNRAFAVFLHFQKSTIIAHNEARTSTTSFSNCYLWGMGKNKLSKFEDMAGYPHVFQYPFSVLKEQGFELKGWNL